MVVVIVVGTGESGENLKTQEKCLFFLVFLLCIHGGKIKSLFFNKINIKLSTEINRELTENEGGKVENLVF